MPTLALVMIVKNEEKSLARCLKQAAGLADKIFITDTGSSDRTREIAASFGAVVAEYTWDQDFAAARNFPCPSRTVTGTWCWMQTNSSSAVRERIWRRL